MGSASDSAPGPDHTSGVARPSVPMRLRSRPLSFATSKSSRQCSHTILPAVGLVTPSATVSGNGDPPAQQPKLFDRLRDSLRTREYGLVGNHLRPRLRLIPVHNPLLLVTFMPFVTWRLRLTLGQLGGHRRKPDNS
jgi:hypothetical protein